MASEKQIWTYIPISEFELPCAPTRDAARGTVRRLWKTLLKVLPGEGEPAKDAVDEEHSRDRAAADLLDSLSPEPDWNHSAASLAEALRDDWFENPHTDTPLQVFVGPPGTGISQALHLLAEQQQIKALEAPSPDALLELDFSETSAAEAIDQPGDQPLFIPRLEHWYLRHEAGMGLVWQLVDRLVASGRRVAIGCDSWAWAFLKRAVGIESMLGRPFTLAPLDGTRLDAWFRTRLDLQTYTFCYGGDKELVFPDSSDDDTSEKPDCSAVLRSLAARARGNPTVAVALWRAGLRACDSEQTKSSGQAVSGSLFAVDSPADVQSPKLSVEMDRLHRFVLHALLLHGGLPLPSVVALLPFSCEQIRYRVEVLQRSGVCEERDGRLRVTAAAYPTIRRDLLNEGFLADAF